MADKPEKFAHPSCLCAARKDSEYCSTYCEDQDLRHRVHVRPSGMRSEIGRNPQPARRWRQLPFFD